MDITAENLKAEILDKPKAIIDFWAPWCSPCIKFKPIFEEVASNTKDIAFGKVNIEDNRPIAMDFQVMSIPTIIFFKDGEEAGRFTGSVTKESFQDKIKEFLS